MRFGNKLRFTEGNRGRVEWRLNERELEALRRLRKGRRIFLGDMYDIFHEDIPSGLLWRVFQTMEETPQHTYLLLTKRPELAYTTWNWPENVQLGVSAEDQPNADRRVSELLKVGVANQIRYLFVSCEPLLGPIDLTLGSYLGCIPCNWKQETATRQSGPHTCFENMPHLDLVIVGGESGPGGRRLVERCDHREEWTGGAEICKCCCEECDGTGWRPKPEALEWVRSLRDQCAAAGVPFHFKQWPIPPYRQGGPHLLDGRPHREVP